MERRPVSIPRSAIPPEAIRYSDVRSRVEIASEAPPVVNFRESNLRILYVDLSMSSKSVGRAIGFSKDYASRIMQRQGIVMRSSSDPVYRERKLGGISSFYADPIKVAEKNARVHTPEARKKQGNALRQRYETDAQYRTRQVGILEKARVASRVAGEKRRVGRVDQVNERIRVEREKETQFARRLLKRPEFKMLSPRQRQVIELRFRIDGNPALTLEQVGKALGGISRQAVQQYETNALVKLGVLKRFGKRSSQKIGG